MIKFIKSTSLFLDNMNMMFQFQERLARNYQKGGIRYVLMKLFAVGFREIKNFFINLYFQLIPAKKFLFQGRAYNYFRHTYNKTWQNERAIEVPIVYEMVKKAESQRKRILEIGNVLKNYYGGLHHTVLDKYEKAPGVVNEDVVNFIPPHPFDLIISISTIEHVGWDEEEKSPKFFKALAHLKKNCLADGGMLIITVPLGYNRYLDEFLERGELGFTVTYFLERISKNNRWVKTNYEKAGIRKFGTPFPNANALMVGIYQKDGNF